MSNTEEVADPWPGIRAVLVTGCLAGNIAGLLHVLLAGYLLQSWWFHLYALLAAFGTMAGVGIVGMMAGTLVGLSTRMFLHGMRISESWWPPVILSGFASASLGLCIAAFLVAMLFEPSK
ncbi:MAG: hypothetical protein K2X38_21850 [Gemmataceae bacterium]|nr:hypothetical protein [Gemmataceae bacterium]